MYNKKATIKLFLLASAFFILSFGVQVKAVNLGESVSFNIDDKFDSSTRSQIQAVLVLTKSNLHFYIDKNWWDLQVTDKKNEVLAKLDILSLEFDSKIYPGLTSVYGSEWRPGVDGDNKITILFHSMKDGTGGYFRSADEYIKLQVPDSNEKEMLYLPIGEIDNTQLKVFLAHELVHLITFNQKDHIWGVQEEVWLNEARADFASTILGYDNSYENSNLQRRVKDFLQSPGDSLTEWQDTKYDYAVVNLFVHYLVDHYDVTILSDSLRSKLVGIDSINESLLKQGAEENFSQIFTNWTIAMVINDCSLDLKYCYLNQNLKDLRINPTLNFLPVSGSSSLSVTNLTKNWSGNWQKIIGGNGDLALKFRSLQNLNFKVPYIVFSKDNSYSLKFLELNKNEEGQIELKNFGNSYSSLTIIPSLQTKTSGFDSLEFTYPYTFTVSVTSAVPQEDEILIQKLLAQIDSLKEQIADILAKNNSDVTCPSLEINLYLGVKNINQVKCLQQFLKARGSEIYPEGFVTGFFGNLTKSAVARFQTKYQIPSTGFVGILTRAKINQILSSI